MIEGDRRRARLVLVPAGLVGARLAGPAGRRRRAAPRPARPAPALRRRGAGLLAGRGDRAGRAAAAARGDAAARPGLAGDAGATPATTAAAATGSAPCSCRAGWPGTRTGRRCGRSTRSSSAAWPATSPAAPKPSPPPPPDAPARPRSGGSERGADLVGGDRALAQHLDAVGQAHQRRRRARAGSRSRRRPPAPRPGRPSRARRAPPGSTGRLSSPERLRLVAVTGKPAAATTCSVAGWSGTRSPTVPSRVTSVRGSASVCGTTTVSGPGVNAPMIRRAAGESTRVALRHLDRRHRHVHRVGEVALLDPERPQQRLLGQRRGGEQVAGLRRQHREPTLGEHVGHRRRVAEAQQAGRGHRGEPAERGHGRGSGSRRRASGTHGLLDLVGDPAEVWSPRPHGSSRSSAGSGSAPRRAASAAATSATPRAYTASGVRSPRGSALGVDGRPAAGRTRPARTCARRRRGAAPPRTPAGRRWRSARGRRRRCAPSAACARRTRRGRRRGPRTCRAAGGFISSPACQPPVPALWLCTSSRRRGAGVRRHAASAAAATASVSSRSAIGERQMLPMQTCRTVNGGTQRARRR